MRPIISVRGTAVPLDRSDVDTDQIIPSAWLKRVERTGFGEGLFAAWRADPGFVLNDDRYRGARVLLAGPNFGTGSSREHAVWALMDYGFEAVVSSRFADIFRSNCAQAGLLTVEVTPAESRRLLEAVAADPTVTIAIDVASRTITAAGAGLDTTFPLDDHTQWRFLEGLDQIGLALRHRAAIDTFESARPPWMPVTAG